MAEHADSIYPVLWASERSATYAVCGVGLRATFPADLAAGVYALLLRYGGPRDLTLRVRAAAQDRWIPLDLKAGEAASQECGGQTVGSCRAAVRRLWAERLGDGTLTYLEAAGPKDLDSIVFAFTREPGGLWSLRVQADALPADQDALPRIASHAAAFVNSESAQPVGMVRYLTEAEQAAIQRVNDTRRPLPARLCIHQLVEDAADRTPDRHAVIQQDQLLTYRELDEKASALARTLIGRGVAVGWRVGIVSSRSAEFVVAALAVLKAGAAYVPLDSALPRLRLDQLYRLGKVDLVIADAGRQTEAAKDSDRWLVLDRASDMASESRARLPQVPVSGRDLAYLIFTSGSSGEPKGALLDHIGRANLIDDLNDRLGITARDRVLVVSSPSFDMSVYDIFGSLAAGATVVLPARGHENDVGHWVDLVAEHELTVWHSVPSSLSLFLNAWPGKPGGSLRLFLLGGDWIPLGQPEAIWHMFPRARVVSLGGATEVSVDSVIFDVLSVDPRWKSIPYGRPLANQTAHILDDFGMTAAIGQIGELCLGGAGVSWGYQDRPAFTAERFVPDPFGTASGGRLYRTGDLARMRQDGVIELIGRADSQVKIGGVRIELGETEACLRQHPDVSDAVVVPVRGASGRAQLIAAFLTITAAGAKRADAQAVDSIRAHLLDRLPATMVPARITILDRLPVNQNGKVDRRLLESWHAKAAAPAVAVPVDARLAGAVAEIWRDVLGLEVTPGPDDSFYDLGGSSMAAIQVVGRLNRHFGADIKVTDLVDAGTLAHVAAIVHDRSKHGSDRPALPGRALPGSKPGS